MSDTSEDLHRKYRPIRFKQLVGQDALVKSLDGLFESGNVPHVFLFTGSSGCGKTTCARIIASELECAAGSIIEIDAATHTGIDAMRELTNSVRYKGFGEFPTKVVIIDEMHMLSKAAMNSLLKDLEDTPEHVYYILCTTEVDKVPKTIKTRAHHYTVADVKHDDLVDLLESVCRKEKIKLDSKQLSVIAREAQGSPRMALVNLSMCRNAKSRDAVRDTLKSAEGSKEFIDLARLLTSGKPKGMAGFNACKAIVSGIDAPPETMRLSLTSYVSKCIVGGTRNTRWLLHVLNCLSEGPYNPSEKVAPTLIMLGDVYLGEDDE